MVYQARGPSLYLVNIDGPGCTESKERAAHQFMMQSWRRALERREKSPRSDIIDITARIEARRDAEDDARLDAVIRRFDSNSIL